MSRPAIIGAGDLGREVPVWARQAGEPFAVKGFIDENLGALAAVKKNGPLTGQIQDHELTDDEIIAGATVQEEIKPQDREARVCVRWGKRCGRRRLWAAGRMPAHASLRPHRTGVERKLGWISIRTRSTGPLEANGNDTGFAAVLLGPGDLGLVVNPRWEAGKP